MNKHFQFLLSAIFFNFLIYTSASAQQTDFQSWNTINANYHLNEKWLITLETQARFVDDFEELGTTLVRPALGYNLTEKLTAYLGYAWTPNYTNSKYEDDFRNEHRVWQQITYKQSFLGLDWQHRLRQEQRFIEHTGSTAHRTRYAIRGNFKFSKEDNYGLTGSNEIFVNLNTVDNGPKAGFDRYRYFLGPFFEVGNARYEAGYQGEYGKRFGDDDRVINAISLSATFNF
jgi:Protein of unknown function (DUF2490)